ncbi:MAG: hypothetical protein ACYCTE_10395 [Acidimicrobiales bacterium]
MSSPDETLTEAKPAIDAGDLAWLEVRQAEYQELLAYLHDH